MDLGSSKYACDCTDEYNPNTNCKTKRKCENGSEKDEYDVCQCKGAAELYKGKWCDIPTCVNEGRYAPETKTCDCPFGFHGKHCEEFSGGPDGPFDGGCKSNPCKNNGNCYPTAENAFDCNCRIGFDGSYCENQLPSPYEKCQTNNLCWHGGVCQQAYNTWGYLCTCQPYWTGRNCEIDVDECNLSGVNICRNNATCINYSGGFTCICPSGWMGKTCQADIDECNDPAYFDNMNGVDSPCIYGNCENLIMPAGDFKCHCPEHLGGKYCERPRHWCDSSPCGQDSLCHIIHEKISCTCSSHWTGTYCDVPTTGFNPNVPKGICNPTPCQNAGICEEVEDDHPDLALRMQGYVCYCEPKTTGLNCEIRVPQCKSGACRYGTCRELWDYEGEWPVINPDDPTDLDKINFHCICDPGYTGIKCQENIDDCEPNPCNGFPCFDFINNYKCDCRDTGFTGHHCEVDINECISTPCFEPNTIECYNNINEYHCQCKEGWTGTNCKTDINMCHKDYVDPPFCTKSNTKKCIDHKPGAGNYTCDCLDGFTGMGCEIDIDECASNPCTVENLWVHDYWALAEDEFELVNRASGNCTQGIDFYKCECPEGRKGLSCEIDIDECASMPCLNNAHNCTHALNEVICNCTSGWTGHYCEINIDECASNPCHHPPGGRNYGDILATCIDNINHYICKCSIGWTGINCDEFIDYCLSSPCSEWGTCQNQQTPKPIQYKYLEHQGLNGTFVPDLGGYHCHCPYMRTGVHCETLVDFCESDPCQNTGICILDDTNDSYKCSCPPATTGYNCETFLDSCASSPCLFDGTCMTIGFDAFFWCSCPLGQVGDYCEINLNECDSNPCLNNGFCFDKLFNEFECRCQSGFTGKNCEINIDECQRMPCFDAPEVKCVDLTAAYRCDCPHFRSGDRCEILEDYCVSDPCGENGICRNYEGFYECTCKNGFNGQNCDNNIDECWSQPCSLYRSVCVDLVDEYRCDCLTGYAHNGTKSVNDGKNICPEIDECSSSPCENNGLCLDRLNKFICECQTGWEGVTCQNDILDCASHPCENGATCTEKTSTTSYYGHRFTCTCPDGYEGDLCENEINECASNPCIDTQGICDDKVNYYRGVNFK